MNYLNEGNLKQATGSFISVTSISTASKSYAFSIINQPLSINLVNYLLIFSWLVNYC